MNCLDMSILEDYKGNHDEHRLPSYDDKCFQIYNNTELLDRDSLTISEGIMFDHGSKVYTERRGKSEK